MPRVSDAHRAARRRQILDAAIECFAREGFHRTSMTQIIAEAELSAGAIYLYFASKDDIVEAIAEERHGVETALATRALANPDTRQALHNLADGYFEWLSDPAEQRRRRVTVQVWAEALRNERVAAVVHAGTDQRQPIADFVVERQHRGDIIPELDPDGLSRVMLSLVLGFILQQAWDPTLDIGGYRAVIGSMIDGFLVVERSEGPPARGTRARAPGGHAAVRTRRG